MLRPRWASEIVGLSSGDVLRVGVVLDLVRPTARALRRRGRQRQGLPMHDRVIEPMLLPIVVVVVIVFV